jgi:ribosomal protein S18 acetylase RimI-like enzyme
MRVLDLDPSQVEAVRAFLVANGWSHRVGDSERFATLIRSSQRTAVALDGPEIVGFARAITDGLSNGYLSMVAVAPPHRRKGVGSALVAHVTAGTPEVTWVLRAGREGAAEFFAKLGFRASPVAMQRARRHSGT